MEPIKIIIPGLAVVKKNSVRHSFFYKDKSGRAIPRPAPVSYYSPQYKDWAKIAIQTMINFKSRHTDIQFPIQEQINLACKFFFNKNIRIDLTNLMEGVQDVLAGNAGVYKESVPKQYYQIIEDDCTRFVASIDGSRYIYSPSEEPHTEVIITEFKW